jgi:hypothetical protein
VATAIVATSVLAAPMGAGAASTSRRSAGSSGDPVAAASARLAAARQQADAHASRYFAALNRGARLELDVADLEARLRIDEVRASGLRARAAARARQIYQSSGSDTITDLFAGEDPLESARRDRLVAAANARDENVFTDLARQNEAMRARRRQLRDDQKRQRDTAAKLRSAQATLDAQLASAQKALSDARAVVAAQRAAQAAQAAQAARQATPASPGRRPANRPAQPGIVITTPPIGGAPSGGGGGSHHDDPFLACTRARESRGNYGVVNPAGPWYGAYQFAESTWNSVANHTGRLDLVGVRPNAASPADQDEMAWALYQWQGKGPWGGRC